jgi:hypothetical protein
MGNFVPISNRYACIRSSGLKPYKPGKILSLSCKTGILSTGIVYASSIHRHQMHKLQDRHFQLKGFQAVTFPIQIS